MALRSRRSDTNTRGSSLWLPQRPNERPWPNISATRRSSGKRHSTKIDREETGIMTTRHPARTNWSRRDILRGGSATALMGAYGFAPRYGLAADIPTRSEEHTSELQSPCNLVCRLLLEKKKT